MVSIDAVFDGQIFPTAAPIKMLRRLTISCLHLVPDSMPHAISPFASLETTQALNICKTPAKSSKPYWRLAAKVPGETRELPRDVNYGV